MLAYVFWHRPRAGVAPQAYEAALLTFHDRLAQEPLEGVHGSAVYALDRIPWLGDEPGYEDWYFVEAAFALDTLNRAAVSGDPAAPHHAVAALTGAMTAGLYRQAEGAWHRQLVLGPVPELAPPGERAAGRRPLRAGP